MKTHKAIESVLALVLLSIILFLMLGHSWILTAGLILGLLGALSERAARLLHQGWSLLTQAIGFMMSRIVLSLVFFLFLTPIALLYRAFSPNAFYKRGGDSYYKLREYVFRAKDLKNPW
jgi:predicted membrane protein